MRPEFFCISRLHAGDRRQGLDLLTDVHTADYLRARATGLAVDMGKGLFRLWKLLSLYQKEIYDFYWLTTQPYQILAKALNAGILEAGQWKS